MALIEAHITKVEKEIGSEWGTIYTDHGTVKKLTTKIAEKLAEAAQLKQSGALAGIEYTERVKRLDDGRTFRNYYYEQAGSLGSNGAGSAADGIDIVQPPPRREDPERNWRICLQTGGKLAVSTLPLMPTEQRDFETQKTIARAWAEFFFFTPPPGEHASVRSQPVVPTSHMGAYAEPDIEQPPPLTDDAFPF